MEALIMVPCSTTKTSQNLRKKKSGNRKQMQCKIVTSQELCKEKETSMAKKHLMHQHSHM
jgi:hypothetical protein